MTLPLQLLVGMFRPRMLLLLGVVCALLLSAFGVIYVVHLNRQLYGELQVLQAEQDALDYEYEKLLLEQSAWSDYSRVEKLSRRELTMHVPPLDEIVMVGGARRKQSMTPAIEAGSDGGD